MKIRLVEESEEYPICPECGIPLWFERTEYTDSQKETMKKQSKCDHEWNKEPGILGAYCTKCGYDPSTHFFASAKLMRCPKCTKLYHVE